jgi:hypothetical protein
MMIDYLTYYFNHGADIFQSISALPDAEALQIMEQKYFQYKDNILFERFSNPKQYLHERRKTENWVKEEFIKKGGVPQEQYPISMVLGSSNWISRNAPSVKEHREIRISIHDFKEQDISFTFPDSMISYWLGSEKPEAYYEPNYHGRVFTITEINQIVGEKGLPEENWTLSLPEKVGPYIEAQIWNHEVLKKYQKRFVAR